MTAYHPKTDGLMVRFHRMLLDMLSKTTVDHVHDWDLHFLFSYRVAEQKSTKALPFILLYGQEARLPTTLMKLPDLRLRNSRGLPERHTGEEVGSLEQCKETDQKVPKEQYDRKAEEVQWKEGHTVYMFMPAN